MFESSFPLLDQNLDRIRPVRALLKGLMGHAWHGHALGQSFGPALLRREQPDAPGNRPVFCIVAILAIGRTFSGGRSV